MFHDDFIANLQMSLYCRWNNFENWSITVGKVTDKSTVACFLTHGIVTSPLGGVQSIVMSKLMTVCLFVCLSVCLSDICYLWLRC